MATITDEIASVSLKDADRDPDGFAAKLGRSFEDYGFAIIADHGIPDELIDRAEEKARAFFALPDEVKRGYFIEGLGGAQFCIPAALDRLRAERSDPSGEAMPSEALILAAADPANPYGTSLAWPRWSDEDRRPLTRSAGAYVVLVDGEPVIYLGSGGKSMDTLPAFADRAKAAFAINALRQLVADGRVRSLQIERVDGASVNDSPHPTALADPGFQRSYRGWLLRA